MKVVLYVVVVIAGVMVPFCIKEEQNWKEKTLHYLVVLADIGILVLASIRGYISIPGHGIKESILMGIVMILMGIPLARIHRLIDKSTKKDSKTQHKTAA